MLDGTGARKWITKTTAGESSPRWAKNDTAITYVREGNLFIVPVDGAGVQQLTDVGPKKIDPRLTDSQKFMRDEEEKLLEAVKEQKDKKKKADEKDKLDKLPALELQDRQAAVDLMLSPDDTHAFVLVVRAPRRRPHRHRPELRQRDRLHRGHSRPHGRRRRAEPHAARDHQSQDRQDRLGGRQLRAAE